VNAAFAMDAAFAIDAARALALKRAAVGRKYQKSAELLIRKAPFARLVHEVANDFKVLSAALCSHWSKLTCGFSKRRLT
jgi:hypothetical protein